jgi:capsular polysaccharide biosynthesis protein
MTIIYQIPDCSNFEFYHWFYYALATLYQIKDISGTVFFTVPMQNLEFQISSLKLLEHTFKCVNDINDLPDKDNIVYTKLHNIIAGDNNIPEQKEIYSFLRTNLLDKNIFTDIKQLSRLIYISREKTPTKVRHVLNESIIIPLLKEIGFEIIYLEDYTLNEKIRIFMEAKVLISFTGGALSLGIFINKDAHVIQLVNDTVFKWGMAFFSIFKELNLTVTQYTNFSTVDDNMNTVTSRCENANIILDDISDFINCVNTCLKTV